MHGRRWLIGPQRHSAASSTFGRFKLPKPLKRGRGAAPRLELVLLLSTAALLMSLAIRAARVVNRVQECRCGAAVLVKAALDGEIRSSGGRSEGRVPLALRDLCGERRSGERLHAEGRVALAWLDLRPSEGHKGVLKGHLWGHQRVIRGY